MLKLNEKYEVVRKILKFDFIRYSPSEISTINTANSRIYNNIPREGSVIPLLNSYLEINFDVLNAATNIRYADRDERRFVKLVPIALFSNNKLTTSSGKHLENIEHGHIACLKYNIVTTARGCDDFSFGFDRSCERRQREVFIKKIQKENIMSQFV